jgi:hypothetical protein
MPEKEYIKVLRKDFDIEYNVRKMSDDEIDNSKGQWYCSDETGHIFKENELILNYNPMPEKELSEEEIKFLNKFFPMRFILSPMIP